MVDGFDDLDFGSVSFDSGFDTSGNNSLEFNNNQGNNFSNQFDNAGTNFNGASNGELDDGINPFVGSLDSNTQIGDGTDVDPLSTGGSKPTSMYAIILVVIGIVAVIIVFIVATKINKISKEPERQAVTQQVVTQQQVVPQQNANVNVDSTLGNSYTTAPNVSVVAPQSQTTKTTTDNEDWIEITSGENVVFNSDYSEMTFTITEIKHLTRLVDTNKNLVVKTRLRGSISGLPGTYEIDVPYNKGVKLVVGNNFTVHVQLGTFNDKTVVGEIRY